MPTLEERVQALEQEITARKQTEETLIQEIAARKQAEEMLAIAVRALVSKEAFERLQETIKEFQEQNGKLFNVLINQGTTHNQYMTDLQGQIIDLDGNVKRLQTETRQQFTEVREDITGLKTEVREDITGLKTDVADLKSIAQQILARLPKEP